jgi:hypothetical protein
VRPAVISLFPYVLQFSGSSFRKSFNQSLCLSQILVALCDCSGPVQGQNQFVDRVALRLTEHERKCLTRAIQRLARGHELERQGNARAAR